MAQEFTERDNNYALLAAAIVEQACKDAMGYFSYGKKEREKSKDQRGDEVVVKHRRIAQMEEVKRFFTDKNSIFSLCMPNTDGKALLDQVYENFKKYGDYMPPTAKRSYAGECYD